MTITTCEICKELPVSHYADDGEGGDYLTCPICTAELVVAGGSAIERD